MTLAEDQPFRLMSCLADKKSEAFRETASVPAQNLVHQSIRASHAIP